MDKRTKINRQHCLGKISIRNFEIFSLFFFQKVLYDYMIFYATVTLVHN